MNQENFYIVATDPHDCSLQVNISGPYLTREAAQADPDMMQQINMFIAEAAGQ